MFMSITESCFSQAPTPLSGMSICASLSLLYGSLPRTREIGEEKVPYLYGAINEREVLSLTIYCEYSPARMNAMRTRRKGIAHVVEVFVDLTARSACILQKEKKRQERGRIRGRIRGRGRGRG